MKWLPLLMLLTFAGSASAASDADCGSVPCSVENPDEERGFLTAADRVSNSERMNEEVDKPDRPVIERPSGRTAGEELLVQENTQPGYSSQPFQSSQSYGNRAFRVRGNINPDQPELSGTQSK